MTKLEQGDLIMALLRYHRLVKISSSGCNLNNSFLTKPKTVLLSLSSKKRNKTSVIWIRVTHSKDGQITLCYNLTNSDKYNTRCLTQDGQRDVHSGEHFKDD